MDGIHANAGIREDQYVDLVWKNLKLKFLGQPYEELLITTDPRYKHYKANEDRNILNNGLLFMMFNAGTGSVNTTKFSSQSNSSMKFSEVCTVNLESKPELPRQKLPTGKSFIAHKWRNYSRIGTSHVNKASENHGLTAASTAFPCKDPNEHQRTPCRFICCRNYLRAVATKRE